jgi:hypothetical protein
MRTKTAPQVRHNRYRRRTSYPFPFRRPFRVLLLSWFRDGLEYLLTRHYFLFLALICGSRPVAVVSGAANFRFHPIEAHASQDSYDPFVHFGRFEKKPDPTRFQEGEG